MVDDINDKIGIMILIIICITVPTLIWLQMMLMVQLSISSKAVKRVGCLQTEQLKSDLIHRVCQKPYPRSTHFPSRFFKILFALLQINR